ncbi:MULTISPECIES: flippase [Natrialbaceae]|uniref:flippase n=1 Tax=Natrialbaceae TaxID=1644061 RepID=UPI00207D3D87|nr:flippase [Natronococcus sp. CG52]
MSETDSESKKVTQSLGSVFQGASFFSVGYIISNAFGFIAQVLLTRLLGASGYGIFSFAQTGLLLARRISNLGSNKSLMKYLPAQTDTPTTQEDTLTLAYVTSFSGSVVTASIVIAMAPTIASYTIDDPIFIDVLRLFAIILVFDTIMQVTSNTFRALELAKYDVLIRKIAWHGLTLAAAVISFLLGLQVLETTITVVIASVLTLLYGFYLSSRHLEINPSWSTDNVDIQEYYTYSVPLSAKDMGQFFYTRTDILMVGIFFSAASVGTYNIAVLLASFITLPVSAIGQLFPPIASRLYFNNDLDELNEIFTVTSRWSFTCSIPLTLGAIIYHKELLSLFGREFIAGGTILIILSTAKLIDSSVGPSGYLLMMTDHQYIVFLNQWVAAILNIILNYLFILQFGLIGAAYASAVVLVVLNIARAGEVWYLEGMIPISQSFLKPIIASLPCASAMLLLPKIFPTPPVVTMFIAGAISIGVYTAAIFSLGLNKADRRLYDSL